MEGISGDSSVLLCASLLRTIFRVISACKYRMGRNSPQVKLDSGMYVRFLLNEHGHLKMIPQNKSYRWKFFKLFLNLFYQALFQKRKTIKMIGHHSRLRNVMDQSYPINACIRANHARYSSVHLTFCLLRYYLGKNLTSRKFRAYRTIWYTICGKIPLFKTTWT